MPERGSGFRPEEVLTPEEKAQRNRDLIEIAAQQTVDAYFPEESEEQEEEEPAPRPFIPVGEA